MSLNLLLKDSADVANASDADHGQLYVTPAYAVVVKDDSGVDHTINAVPADGDYGAITITAGVWALDAGVVSTTNLGGDITAAGKALLDDADATAQRATLGLTIGTNVQAYSLPLDYFGGLTPTGDGLPYFNTGSSMALTTLTSFARLLLDDTDAATMRATLDLEPGTDVQAYDADLAAIAGLTPSDDDVLQRKAGAWTNRTIAQVTTDLQGTGLAADTVGFRGIPQVTFSAATTIAATHEGKDLVHPASDANARTITIDSNANLALPIGFTFSGYNDTSQAVTIAITADTLVWIGTGGTGSRTVAQYGSWVCRKIDTTRWIIGGVNIT